jgi:hypothetical protein
MDGDSCIIRWSIAAKKIWVSGTIITKYKHQLVKLRSVECLVISKQWDDRYIFKQLYHTLVTSTRDAASPKKLVNQSGWVYHLNTSTTAFSLRLLSVNPEQQQDIPLVIESNHCNKFCWCTTRSNNKVSPNTGKYYFETKIDSLPSMLFDWFG